MLWEKSRKCTRGVRLTVEDCSADPSIPFPSVFVLVEYHGKTLVYDMLDGYQHQESIQYYLQKCDFYFKRSYSKRKNEELGLMDTHKMYPLGFNYHVSCHNHPTDKPAWKEFLKKLMGLEYNNYCSTAFSRKAFEAVPQYKGKKLTVMFSSRLWGESSGIDEEWNKERRYINHMRIDILRQLKSRNDIRFVGGLTDSELSREMAPDLIIPAELTRRSTYLKQMKKADICIGSMGLFESIGWKTGEYVAAGKAIINERFHYEVPGNFEEGKHYLGFDTAQECIRAVETLLEDPQRVYQMKKTNEKYYKNYLRPDMLIQNTLDIADGKIRR
jgi:hypothetical protein